MKKVILWLVLLNMVAVLSVPVAAAATTAVEASQSVAEPGQKVTFTVSVKDAAKIRSMAVLPIYDAESFDLVEGKWLISGMLSDFDMEKGLGVIAMAGAVDANTKVFQFVLQVKETAQPGQKEIGSTVVLMDGAGQRTELTAACAQVTLAGEEEIPETTQKPTEPAVDNTQPTQAEKDDTPEPTQKATEPTAEEQSVSWADVAAAFVFGGVAASMSLE